MKKSAQKTIFKRVLTGDRPTGNLHLGHYFGSLQNRIELQDKYETFIMLADIQALTDHFQRTEDMYANVREVLIDNLSVGLDPKKVTFFIQSQIPEIAELTVLFSNLVTISRLQRNPTVKQELREKVKLFGKRVTLGFLGYPVNQAADISFCRAAIVPVGVDQLPMIEQTREIVSKFNALYGVTFPLPEAMLGKGKRIRGLDGNAKMSKSLNNAIYLKDSDDEIRSKIKSATTDSGSEIAYDEKSRPEISNLLLLYSLVSGQQIQKIVAEYKGSGYASFKEKLGEQIITFLQPIKEKRAHFEKDENLLQDILQQGIKKARIEAEETMKLVRKNMKINYFS